MNSTSSRIARRIIDCEVGITAAVALTVLLFNWVSPAVADHGVKKRALLGIAECDHIAQIRPGRIKTTEEIRIGQIAHPRSDLVAVADGNTCFITSANLTGYAMERNMEAGVLITGGQIPRMLNDHLRSLVETRVVNQV